MTPNQQAPSGESVTRNPQLPGIWGLAIVAGILFLAYAPAVHWLVRDWLVDENVSHGFFVPLVAGYIAWNRRHELARAELHSHWFGLVIVIGAGLQLYVGILGVELFLARTALVFAVIGSVLFLGGVKALRILAFPLFLLLFMIPIPAIIYNQITLPLQFIASDLAERVLTIFGIPVLREGNILVLPSQTLSVVEACSGIRSLLSLSFLSLVYGYFFESRAWLRAVLFFATVPIAIMTNAARVTVTGLLSEIDTELADGVFHLAEGWIIFVLALVLLLLVHRLILAIPFVKNDKQPAAD
jgi:exosortase